MGVLGRVSQRASSWRRSRGRGIRPPGGLDRIVSVGGAGCLGLTLALPQEHAKSTRTMLQQAGECKDPEKEAEDATKPSQSGYQECRQLVAAFVRTSALEAESKKGQDARRYVQED